MNQQQKKFTLTKAFSMVAKKAYLIQEEGKKRNEVLKESRKYTTADFVRAIKNQHIVLKKDVSNKTSHIADIFDLDKMLNLPALPDGYSEYYNGHAVRIKCPQLKESQSFSIFFKEDVDAINELQNTFDDIELELILGSEQEALDKLSQLKISLGL